MCIFLVVFDAICSSCLDTPKKKQKLNEPNRKYFITNIMQISTVFLGGGVWLYDKLRLTKTNKKQNRFFQGTMS